MKKNISNYILLLLYILWYYYYLLQIAYFYVLKLKCKRTWFKFLNYFNMWCDYFLRRLLEFFSNEYFCSLKKLKVKKIIEWNIKCKKKKNTFCIDTLIEFLWMLSIQGLLLDIAVLNYAFIEVRVILQNEQNFV